MKRIVAIVLLVAFALSLAACGGEKIIGSWETDASVVGVFDDEGKTYVTLTFDEGGIGASDIIGTDVHTTTNFSYETDGNSLTVTTDSGTTAVCEYSIEGDVLSITYENKTVEYTRVPD